MHLTADRATVRTRDAIAREQTGFRYQLVQILSDRQRIPHRGALMAQARHEKRRRQQQQLRTRRGIVARQNDFGEIQVRQLAKQPAAQRPGRVVPAAESESGLRHRRDRFMKHERANTAMISAKNRRCSIQCRGCQKKTERGASMLYASYQMHSDMMGPMRAAAASSAAVLGMWDTGPSSVVRHLTAACELLARTKLTHRRPAFGIDTVTVAGREIGIHEEAAQVTPFGTL